MPKQLSDNRTSQREKIKSYLLSGGKLTSLSGLERFQTLRLSERIREIEADGVKINREWIKVGQKHVMEYSLGDTSAASV